MCRMEVFEHTSYFTTRQSCLRERPFFLLSAHFLGRTNGTKVGLPTLNATCDAWPVSYYCPSEAAQPSYEIEIKTRIIGSRYTGWWNMRHKKTAQRHYD